MTQYIFKGEKKTNFVENRCSINVSVFVDISKYLDFKEHLKNGVPNAPTISNILPKPMHDINVYSNPCV